MPTEIDEESADSIEVMQESKEFTIVVGSRTDNEEEEKKEEASNVDPEVMALSDCPICLETLHKTDKVYALPCKTCQYNYCSDCLRTFIKASRDEYEEASDGSKQVKVRISCPQCRGSYPMDVSDLLLLRVTYQLADTVTSGGKCIVDDSELTATQLTQKREFDRKSQRNVELAEGLYRKVMKDCKLASKERIDQWGAASKIWGMMFASIPLDYVATASADAKPAEKPKVDPTLLLGLQDSMNEDEQAFVGELLTSGDTEKVAQAAQVLYGVLHMASTTRTMRLSGLSFDKIVQLSERKDKIKKAFPLPLHMPVYVTLPVFGPKQGYLKVGNYNWDGQVLPSVKKTLWNQIYGNQLLLPTNDRNEEGTHQVVRLQAVRGPAGRVGLRKDDHITHVQDSPWTGSANDFINFVHQLYMQDPNQEISIIVNANQETANFLKMRNRLLRNSKTDFF